MMWQKTWKRKQFYTLRRKQRGSVSVTRKWERESDWGNLNMAVAAFQQVSTRVPDIFRFINFNRSFSFPFVPLLHDSYCAFTNSSCRVLSSLHVVLIMPVSHVISKFLPRKIRRLDSSTTDNIHRQSSLFFTQYTRYLINWRMIFSKDDVLNRLTGHFKIMRCNSFILSSIFSCRTFFQNIFYFTSLSSWYL